MELGPHAGFIIAAYAAGVFVVAALIVWIMADHGSQQRTLDELERQGITRRSAERRQEIA
jgi:heme exporter protein D